MRAPRHIVFLNRFYAPDIAATAQILGDLAEDLARAGQRVTVIASRASYGEGGPELPAREVRNGVTVVRIGSPRRNRKGLLGRMTGYLAYLIGASLALLRLPRIDWVVALTDPPLLIAPAWLVGRIRGARVVYWAQDLYPFLAGRLRVLPEDGLLFRALCALARALHRRCDAVVALGPRMADRIAQEGVPRERLAIVHNWADTASIRPVSPEANPFRARYGLGSRFVVLYSGNAGRAHTFDAVLEAARRLQDTPDILFLFIGGGVRMRELRTAAGREALPNVRFMDYLPRNELAHSLPAADVALVTEEIAAAGFLVPSKTYGILASGRPLLFVGDPRSDVAEVIRHSDCGVSVTPDDAAGLVDALRALHADRELARAMGDRAREAACHRFSRQGATRIWLASVRTLLEGPGTAAPEQLARLLAAVRATPLDAAAPSAPDVDEPPENPAGRAVPGVLAHAVAGP